LGGIFLFLSFQFSFLTWHPALIDCENKLRVRGHEMSGISVDGRLGTNNKCKNTMPQNLRPVRNRDSNGFWNWSVESNSPGAFFTSTDFAPFICLSPRLSVPGSPRMYKDRVRVHQVCASFKTSYSREFVCIDNPSCAGLYTDIYGRTIRRIAMTNWMMFAKVRSRRMVCLWYKEKIINLYVYASDRLLV